MRLLSGVKKAGRISVGAERVHLSQPAVTSALAKLERELRVQLFARTAAGVAPTEIGGMFLGRVQRAIDTLHADFRDTAGLERIAADSYADGFSGMLAIHPAQVAVINAAFTPGEDEVAHARAIVNAFSANPTAGALELDGKMIDQPHLEQARRLLARLR